MCTYVCMHACKAWGVWGHAPPGNFFEITCSEIASEAILRALVLQQLQSTPGIGPSICAFARLADIKFLHDRRYYGWQSSRWGDRW